MSDIAGARLIAQRELGRALASGRELPEAAPAILASISSPLHCVASELWLLDESRRALRIAGGWAEDSKSRAFLAAGSALAFRAGRGLPGLSWERAAPQWMRDAAADAGFERKNEALQCGLHAAVAFPVVHGGEVTGVIQFFYADARQPDGEMMEIFADIGDQVGLFVERTRIDGVARRQAAEILELSAPLLRVAREALLLPVIGTFDSRRAIDVTERLLSRVVELGVKYVVLDMTSAGEMDTFMAQRLLDTVAALKLLGTRAILTGIRPTAARSLVLLGVALQGVDVCASLADGIALAQGERR